MVTHLQDARFLVVGVVTVSGLTIAANPEAYPAAICFVASLALLGFLRWIEHLQAKDELDKTDVVESLRKRVDNLELARTLGSR